MPHQVLVVGQTCDMGQYFFPERFGRWRFDCLQLYEVCCVADSQFGCTGSVLLPSLNF